MLSEITIYISDEISVQHHIEPTSMTYVLTWTWLIIGPWLENTLYGMPQ